MELGKLVRVHEEGPHYPANLVARIVISFQSETFTAPNAGQIMEGANSVAADHGTSGPVRTSFPNQMYGGPQQISFVNSTTNLFGLAYSPDLNGGSPNCVSLIPLVRS